MITKEERTGPIVRGTFDFLEGKPKGEIEDFTNGEALF